MWTSLELASLHRSRVGMDVLCTTQEAKANHLARSANHNRYSPHRVAMMHFAAARARELRHGSQERRSYPAALLALREIAVGTFVPIEIASHLAAPMRDESAVPSLPTPPNENALRDGVMRDAVALASRSEELFDPATG